MALSNWRAVTLETGLFVLNCLPAWTDQRRQVLNEEVSKGGTVNGNDPEPLFQRSERDAWSFHAPHFPQSGHHHHGHDHADCDDVAVRVCVRRRHSNRDSELCQLRTTWDLTDC